MRPLKNKLYTHENTFNFSSASGYNHLYMSFMVLCSVGVGDLLPLSIAVKAAVLVEAVTGQLYLTFFVSIIISKYLNKKPQ